MTISIGGNNTNHGNQVVGEGNISTTDDHQRFSETPWQPVLEHVMTLSLPSQQHSNAINLLGKMSVVDDNTDQSAIAKMIDQIMTYKGLARVVLAAASATPAGVILAPLIRGALEATKI